MSLSPIFPWYFLPLLPLIVRFVILWRYKHLFKEDLDRKAAALEAHQDYLLPLAGFSFAGVIALTVAVSDQTRKELELSTFYVIVGFLGYLSALNIQGYKFSHWEDQIADALIDGASLSLVLSIIFIITNYKYSGPYKVLIIIVGIGAWLFDYVLRMRYLRKMFSGKQTNLETTSEKSPLKKEADDER